MRRCEVNALDLSVKETWKTGKLDIAIKNVFGRLKKVLVLIIEGEGSNDLVETKRGKKTVSEDLPPVSNEMDNNESSSTDPTRVAMAPPLSSNLLLEFDDEEEDGEMQLEGCEM